MFSHPLIIRTLAMQDYMTCWQAMQQFTEQRNNLTPDEIWILQHYPVFTQGQNGKPEHLLHAGDIPVIQTDRGGQITYHGPGQLVAYILIDLKRKKWHVRQIISLLEQSIIQLLVDYHIPAFSDMKAPGVYTRFGMQAKADTQEESMTRPKKICSVGLRIRKGCSYHGLALNVAMDIEPFSRIHPCGFKELKMTQLSEFVPDVSLAKIQTQLIDYLIQNLGYNNPLIFSEFE